MFEVSLIIVFAATLIAPIVGFVWYHPRLFGSTWIRLVNMSPAQLEKSKKHALLLTLGAFAVAFLTAFVSANALLHFRDYWGVLDMGGALSLSALAWSAFIVPVLLGQALWEGRPVKLFAINAGYWLVTLCTMALVITFVL